jgi:hypothetical protein
MIIGRVSGSTPSKRLQEQLIHQRGAILRKVRVVGVQRVSVSERGARAVGTAEDICRPDDGRQAIALELVEHGVHWCEDAYDVAIGADVLVIITEWNEFRALDLDRMGTSMTQKVLVDLRNVYRAEEVREQGFAYTSIGRP